MPTLLSYLHGARFHCCREQEARSACDAVFGDARAAPARLSDGFGASIGGSYQAAFGGGHRDVTGFKRERERK